jgi:hypothetical protein
LWVVTVLGWLGFLAVGYLALTQHHANKRLHETAQISQQNARDQAEAVHKLQEEAALKQAAHQRQIAALRERITEPASRPTPLRTGDILFLDDFSGDALIRYRVATAMAPHYVGLEDEKLILGQHSRTEGFIRATAREAIPFPVGATLRAKVSAVAFGLEQQLSISFPNAERWAPAIRLKRTPWGWGCQPDALPRSPGRAGPQGPITMIIERASATRFRYYYDSGDGPTLIGWGDEPRVTGLESVDLQIEAWSTRAPTEAHFFVDDVVISRAEFANTLTAAEPSLEAEMLALHEVARHVLLPIRLVEANPQNGRLFLFLFRFPFRTPAFDGPALLYVGTNNAKDASGDGGVKFRMLDADGEVLRSGYTKNPEQWVWISEKAEPERDYVFEIHQDDSDFNGPNAGNTLLVGALLVRYADEPGERVRTTYETQAGTEWLDVMPLIDPARDALRGQWAFTGTGLGQTAGAGARMVLQLPVGAAESYELAVEFTKLSGHQSVNFRVPIAGGLPDVTIGGFPENDYASALRYIDDPQPDGGKNPTWTPCEPLDNNRRYHFFMRVEQEDGAVKLSAELDKEPLFAWQGPAHKVIGARARAFPFFAPTFSIGCYHGTVEFYSIRLRSLK